MFSLLLQTIISNQMRPRRLRGKNTDTKNGKAEDNPEKNEEESSKSCDVVKLSTANAHVRVNGRRRRKLEICSISEACSKL